MGETLMSALQMMRPVWVSIYLLEKYGNLQE